MSDSNLDHGSQVVDHDHDDADDDGSCEEYDEYADHVARLTAARAAATVLVMLEGSQTPIEKLLRFLATEEELRAIAEPFRAPTRLQRAIALAKGLHQLIRTVEDWHYA